MKTAKKVGNNTMPEKETLWLEARSSYTKKYSNPKRHDRRLTSRTGGWAFERSSGRRWRHGDTWIPLLAVDLSHLGVEEA